MGSFCQPFNRANWKAQSFSYISKCAAAAVAYDFADKAGSFTFTCSIICGDEHKKMQDAFGVRA